MRELIASRVLEFVEDAIRIRRSIHANPELGNEERDTARLVAGVLQEAGVEVRTEVAGTGVVGLIRGARPGPVIALRADMDALPIKDRKTVEYASRRNGVMHACGHDGHTAALVGTGLVLSKMRDLFSGSVKLIFQPAEEGPGGAKPMIEAGVLEDPSVDIVLGAHIWSDMPVGLVGFISGEAFAGVDELRIVVNGYGGHGASPHLAQDAIVASAYIITALQQVITRHIDPVEPAVLTVGTINGGYRHNVIADSVVMTGTVRTFRTEIRSRMKQLIETTVQGIASSLGTSATAELLPGYPPTINDPRITREMTELACSVFGKDRVLPNRPRCMGGEDFGYYLQEVPGTFMLFGGGNPGQGQSYPHHHPMFDFDERALGMIMEMLCHAVIYYGSKGKVSGEPGPGEKFGQVPYYSTI